MDRLSVMDKAIDNAPDELHERVSDWYENMGGKEYHENMGLFEIVEFSNFLDRLEETNEFCHMLYLAMTGAGLSHEATMETLQAMFFSWPE